MKPARLACLFLFLVAPIFAQSNPAHEINRRPAVRHATASPASPQASGLNFQPAVAYDSGGTYGYSLAVADVNGDGHFDLVVSNDTSATVGVLLGNVDGTFQSAVTYSSGGT